MTQFAQEIALHVGVDGRAHRVAIQSDGYLVESEGCQLDGIRLLSQFDGVLMRRPCAVFRVRAIRRAESYRRSSWAIRPQTRSRAGICREQSIVCSALEVPPRAHPKRYGQARARRTL